MKIRLRRVVWTVVGLAAVAGLVMAFRPRPVPVDLAEVVRGPLRETVDEDGKTRIKERYTVSTPLAGRLARIDLKAGDAVKAGKTLLAAVEPPDPALLDVRTRAETQARVKTAEANYKVTEARLERAKAAHQLQSHLLVRARQLGPSGGVPKDDVDKIEHAEWMAREELRGAQFGVQVSAFEVEQAKAALTQATLPPSAEAENHRFEIRSPIGGKVLRVLQESAAVIPVGHRLLELGDPADLEVEIDVLSRDAVRVAPGMKVMLEHWGGDAPLNGRVRLVEPAAFLKVSALGIEEQRVWLIADLTDPPAKRTRLGDAYRVEARIVLWESNDVLKVPSGALFRHDGGWAVFVASGDRAERRQIKVGHTDGRETEVVGGLAAGERVVVHASDRVKDGVAIEAR